MTYHTGIHRWQNEKKNRARRGLQEMRYDTGLKRSKILEEKKRKKEKSVPTGYADMSEEHWI